MILLALNHARQLFRHPNHYSSCFACTSLFDSALSLHVFSVPVLLVISNTFTILIHNLSSYDTSAALLEKIADLVNDKKLEGISDLRDESDRDGIRVVVELKRDAVPALVQNNLFKKTSLQWAFSGEGSLFFHGPCPSRPK